MPILGSITYLTIEAKHGVKLFFDRFNSLIAGDRYITTRVSTANRGKCLICRDWIYCFSLLYLLTCITVEYSEPYVREFLVELFL